MKVKISFELELSKTDYNINNARLVNECVQNIWDWLYELHNHYLEAKVASAVKAKANAKENKAVEKIDTDNLILSSQLTNIQIEGTTEDGFVFKFPKNTPSH